MSLPSTLLDQLGEKAAQILLCDPGGEGAGFETAGDLSGSSHPMQCLTSSKSDHRHPKFIGQELPRLTRRSRSLMRASCKLSCSTAEMGAASLRTSFASVTQPPPHARWPIGHARAPRGHRYTSALDQHGAHAGSIPRRSLQWRSRWRPNGSNLYRDSRSLGPRWVSFLRRLIHQPRCNRIAHLATSIVSNKRLHASMSGQRHCLANWNILPPRLRHKLRPQAMSGLHPERRIN
jgi:hypothetical protein